MTTTTRRLTALAAAVPLALLLAACSGTSAEIAEPAETSGVTKEKPAAPAEETTPAEAAPAEKGTRENPAQPGVDTITFSDFDAPVYDVTLAPANFDANAVIQAENPYNEAAPEGSQYVLLPVTATYRGAETGNIWLDLRISFVAADGRSFDQATAAAVYPTPLTSVAELYTGGVGTGNMLFAIPSDAISGGTWAISYGFDDTKMFFAAV